MRDTHAIVSKVLVLDQPEVQTARMKTLCEQRNLIGIRPQQGGEDSLMAILRSNVDLGGILLYENYGDVPGDGLALARAIHDARPELPLFLRRAQRADLSDLSPRDAAMFRAAYTLDNLAPLDAELDASIFSRVYPNDLARGIADITRASLSMLFHHCDVDVETPYLVKDRIIYGEVFTLIAIESHWCRGYMMLQCEEDALMAIVRRGAGAAGAEMTFRDLNSTLGEATNLVWGAFKNRYVTQTGADAALSQTQVPIVINHQRRFISFGSEDPQLCLKYTLRERGRAGAVSICQRFVFNLNWSPDAFSENPTVESLFASGELEMF